MFSTRRIKMQKYSRDEQVAHLETWRSGGLSGQAYCRQYGIVPTTFYSWVKAEKRRSRSKSESQPSLVKIQSRKEHAENLAATISIEYRDVRIHLPAAVGMETLKSILILLGVIDAA
jgi:transposase-like protein